MAGPSIARLLGVGRSSTNAEVLRRTSLLQFFFTTWLKLDLTTLAAAVTIFGTISALFRSLKSTSLKLYWWFTRFCTASISIASNDRLNKEILNWIGAQVLERQRTRILTARTETIQTDAWLPKRTTERNDYVFEKRIPIQYLPTFGMTWFIHNKNIFLVRRLPRHESRGAVPQEYASAPEGNEPLVVMCIGRSVAPIKQFLETCRDFAEQQRSAYVTVRVTKSQYARESWDTTILRPMRPLETIHFDEGMKAEIVADVKNYLDTNTRKFYTARGIPYRRGYLLHGTPGTGKTSLSLALAGHFGLELYLCHIPSIKEDNELEKLFTALPPRCMVLLEDIDAVGIRRRPDNKDDDDEDDDERDKPTKSRCTLSGLLNVLDGVASQEGRIVLMTSNYADRLDKALVRPGRIDKMIELGNISQRSAELMFLRMYTPDKTHASALDFELKDRELEKLALSFSSQIPDNTFTPAQLQGLLLNRRNNPHAAVAETAAWVEEELAKMEERKKQNREAAQRRRERKKEKIMEANSAIFPGRVPSFDDPEVLEKLDAMLKAQQMKVATMDDAAREKNISSGDEKGKLVEEAKPEPAKEGEIEEERKVEDSKETVDESVVTEKVQETQSGKADGETKNIAEIPEVDLPVEAPTVNGAYTEAEKMDLKV